MYVDRDIGKTKDGRICSMYDHDCAFTVARRGTLVSDIDAETLGITRYLDECRREEARAERRRALEGAKSAEGKAVDRTEVEVEDKAVEKAAVEDKALHFLPRGDTGDGLPLGSPVVTDVAPEKRRRDR